MAYGEMVVRSMSLYKNLTMYNLVHVCIRSSEEMETFLKSIKVVCFKYFRLTFSDQ